MSEMWDKLKGYILLITYGILLYVVVSNIGQVLAALSSIIVVIRPFILGLLFAYVLNILMSFFERKLFHRLEDAKKPMLRKLKRPLSIATTFLVVFIFITIIVLFLIPQLSESILTFSNNMKNDYIKSISKFIDEKLRSLNLSGEFWYGLSINWNDIITKTSNFLSAALPRIAVFMLSLTNDIINIVVGLIVSVYFLATKEKMLVILKKLIYAFTPEKVSQRIIETGSQANRTFQNFISGQATEALILGLLVFIGMLIFGFPYAVLCSVIIAVTSVIPIFGAWLGAIPSAFIILMAQPPKALWFILFIVILQQLENSLIYPRVVGNSIGLDGLWVLFALIVGGSLFGFTGVILGIPAFAVLYTIIRRITNRRLSQKNIVIR